MQCNVVWTSTLPDLATPSGPEIEECSDPTIKEEAAARKAQEEAEAAQNEEEEPDDESDDD